MANARDPLTLAGELKTYANKHRMMFGKTPESDLLYEIVQHLELEDMQAPKPTPKPKTTTKKTKE